MDLLLIRHAEPVRIEGADGPADPCLHQRGRAQATRLAGWLAAEPSPIDELWSSPLLRALETADPVAGVCRLEVNIGQRLAEWDRHANEYIPIEELRAAKDERWYALVSGQAFVESVDSPENFRAEVVACVEEIVAANAGRRVAVICHGGVINMYVSWVLGLPSENFFLPEYTSVSRIAAARSGERSIVSINETGHLRGMPGW
jgi:probable phosphoglycerate mutase